MDFKNALTSISYLEFINKLDSLSNELLYAPVSGYIYKKSKDAIISRDDYLNQFINEANKLKENISLKDNSEVVLKKKDVFLKNLDFHFSSQISIWAEEVFDDLIKNILFELSLNKENAKQIYSKMLCGLNWFCEIRELSKDDVKDLKKNLDDRFKQILNDKDSDYIEQTKRIKSKPSIFLKLWDNLLQNTDDFLNISLDDYDLELSIDDKNYFQNLKNKLNTYKKDEILDEILLINTACNLSKLKNEQKVEFIKSIQNDFISYLEKNKQINEDEKVKLIKRRLSLLEDSKKTESKYFARLINVSDH